MSTIALRGSEFAYDDAGSGSGPPLVWGHGLTASRESDDEFPLVDLALVGESRRVVRYDARGHGESGSLSGPGDGGWDRLSLDQIALLDALGIDDVVLGGASMGTATALHAAPRLGRRVRGMILAIPPTAWESRRAQTDAYEQMAQIVLARGVEPLIAASRDLPPPDPFLDDAPWRERSAARLRHADPVRLAAAFRGAAVADLPSPDAIATIDAPILVLAWSGDPGHPISTAERLGELMPNAEVVIATTADELATWTDRSLDFLGHTT